jgi:putative ABC transport system permease protein
MRHRVHVPLAWLNLTHDRRRFVLFSLGIALAVVLIFVEYGFRNSLVDSNVLLLRKLNADLAVVSPRRTALPFRESFARHRLPQIAAVPGVRSVHPVYIEYFFSLLRNPAEQPEERPPNRPIRVVGVDPEAYLLTFPELDPAPGAARSRVSELHLVGRALFDRSGKTSVDNHSESIYGAMVPGVETDLAGQRIHIVGEVDLGSDFGTDGTLIMSDESFVELLRRPYALGDSRAEVEIGLVRLDPRADRSAVQREIRHVFSDGDLDILTIDELVEQERDYWLVNTPVGFVFALGMGLSFVIGMVICYQILSSDVTDHMAEYATLKAIGYRNRYLATVVIQQALLMGVSGFLPGVAISWVIYRYLSYLTGMPMWMTPGRIGLVLGLTAVMCVGSGLLALRKAMRLDPAEVF